MILQYLQKGLRLANDAFTAYTAKDPNYIALKTAVFTGVPILWMKIQEWRRKLAAK